MAITSQACRDNDFGPTVQGCRGDFDFTQKFEHIFLAIIPSSIFIALALVRIALLAQHSAIVRGAAFKYAKLVSAREAE